MWWFDVIGPEMDRARTEANICMQISLSPSKVPLQATPKRPPHFYHQQISTMLLPPDTRATIICRQVKDEFGPPNLSIEEASSSMSRISSRGYEVFLSITVSEDKGLASCMLSLYR